MHIIQDSPLTECIVSPDLCKQLQDLGVTQFVSYQWRIRGADAELACYAFDPDQYYFKGNALADYINKGFSLPAYHLKAVEKILPPEYLLTYGAAGNYELSLGDIYRMDSVKSTRLPDVYALMLLACLKRHVVDLNHVNLILNGCDR